MNSVSVFLLVVATIAVCFIFLQAYSIYENFDNILEFNSEYSALEYSKSLGVISIDRRVRDPNDEIFDVKQKWRCVKFDDSYVSVSVFGFRTVDTNPNTIRKFQQIDTCVDTTFSTYEFQIFNPCIYQPNSRECMFLKSIL